MVCGRVAGDLGEDAVLVGGREAGPAAGDHVSAGEGLHGGLLVVGGGGTTGTGAGDRSGGQRSGRAAEARSSMRSSPSTSPEGSVHSTGSKRWADGRGSARCRVSRMPVVGCTRRDTGAV